MPWGFVCNESLMKNPDLYSDFSKSLLDTKIFWGDISMSSRITIRCCSNLFSEGIKRLLEDGMEINHRITISSQEEVLNTKPDILITDFHTLSAISPNALAQDRYPPFVDRLSPQTRRRTSISVYLPGTRWCLIAGRSQLPATNPIIPAMFNWRLLFLMTRGKRNSYS